MPLRAPIRSAAFVMVLSGGVLAAPSSSAAPLSLGAAPCPLPESGVALATADFDADGTPDVAVLGTDGSVSVSRGPGDAPTWTTLDASASFVVADEAPYAGLRAADLDADGATDLVVYGLLDPDLPESCSAAVLWGSGDGAFELGASLVSIPTEPFDWVRGCTEMGVGDYDGNGLLDVALTAAYFPFEANNGLNGYFEVFLAQPGGAFTPAGTHSLTNDTGPFLSYALASDDFDGDGALDLAFGAEIRWLSGPTAWRLEVFRGDGAGSFASSTIRDFDCFYCDIAVARARDYTGDGRPDVILATRTPEFPYPAEFPALFLENAGDGSFLAPSQLATEVGMVGVETEDFTADGLPDVTLIGRDDRITLLAGDGAGGFAAPQRFLSGAPIAAATVEHLDQSSPPALLLLAWDRPELRVATSTGSPPFPLPLVTLAPSAGFPTPADLDRDGQLDVVLAGYDRVDLLLGRGDGGFAPGASITARTYAGRLPVADLDGDGLLDLVVPSQGGFEALLGAPGGQFPPPLDPNTERRDVAALALGDVDADGDLDLAVFEPARSSVDLYTNDGAQHFILLSSSPGYATDLQLADLDGDAVLDLFTAAPGDHTVPASFVRRGVGDGTFAPAEPIELDDYRQLLQDIDADGKLDVISPQRFALGNGDGTFAPAQTWNDSFGLDIAAADLDGDGHIDLATTDGGSIAVALGQADGTFAAPQRILELTGTPALIAADFTCTGLPELAAIQSLELESNLVVVTNSSSPACRASLP